MIVHTHLFPRLLFLAGILATLGLLALPASAIDRQPYDAKAFRQPRLRVKQFWFTSQHPGVPLVASKMKY